MSDLGVTPAEILGQDVVNHCYAVAQSTRFNPLRSADFWESWMAVQLGGLKTPHKHSVDIEVEIWGRLCRAEVKFSQAFYCSYSIIRNRDWSRYSFKWTLTQLQTTLQPADALILLGIDIDDLVYAWVVPVEAIRPGRRSLTVTAPSSRIRDDMGRLDEFAVPLLQVLPVFARISHTRHRKVGQEDLFGPERK